MSEQQTGQVDRGHLEFWPCRWDWCRAHFESRALLLAHVARHARSAPPLSPAHVKTLEGLERESFDELSAGEGTFS